MDLQLQVKITKILEKRSFVSKKDGSNFNIYSFVGATIGEPFPKEICFEVFGDEKYAQMNPIVGNSYSISFDLESREWNGKYFTSLRAWKLVALDNVSVATATEQHQAPTIPSAVPQPTTQAPQKESDLPF